MFEEDFNSAEEDIHLDIYSKKLEKLNVERPLEIKMDVVKRSEPSKSSKENPTNLHTPVDPLKTPTAPTKNPSLDLDSWLDNSPTPESKKISSKAESSDEESDNPLVAPVEGDSDEDEKEAVRSTEGSISAGSNLGFSVLPKKSPNEKALEKPKLKSSKKSGEGKKKKVSEGDSGKKKTKKKKDSAKSAQDNILMEDMTSPVDTEQYESL